MNTHVTNSAIGSTLRRDLGREHARRLRRRYAREYFFYRGMQAIATVIACIVGGLLYAALIGGCSEPMPPVSASLPAPSLTSTFGSECAIEINGIDAITYDAYADGECHYDEVHDWYLDHCDIACKAMGKKSCWCGWDFGGTPEDDRAFQKKLWAEPAESEDSI